MASLALTRQGQATTAALAPSQFRQWNQAHKDLQNKLDPHLWEGSPTCKTPVCKTPVCLTSPSCLSVSLSLLSFFLSVLSFLPSFLSLSRYRARALSLSVSVSMSVSVSVSASVSVSVSDYSNICTYSFYYYAIETPRRTTASAKAGGATVCFIGRERGNRKNLVETQISTP